MKRFNCCCCLYYKILSYNSCLNKTVELNHRRGKLLIKKVNRLDDKNFDLFGRSKYVGIIGYFILIQPVFPLEQSK